MAFGNYAIWDVIFFYPLTFHHIVEIVTLKNFKGFKILANLLIKTKCFFPSINR